MRSLRTFASIALVTASFSKGSTTALVRSSTSNWTRHQSSLKLRGGSIERTSSRLFSNTIDYTSSTFAEVHLVPMFTDNYGFVIVDKSTNAAATVDPGDGKAVSQFLNKYNSENPSSPVDLKMILCTHKHNDHVGGNKHLKSVYPSVDIVGTKYETVPEISKAVGHGDSIQFGGLHIQVYHTPCHTKGHVIYAITPIGGDGREAPLLFCGDTLFVGGCGRFFEGTAKDMLANMDLISSTFPPESKVYCAHEYTESNLKFLASVDKEGCGPVYEEVKRIRSTGAPTVPTVLGKEMQYNLFMRCRDPRVMEWTNSGTAEEAMHNLREMKNSF
jgi:hydroxyacylglutathione hydrolase